MMVGNGKVKVEVLVGQLWIDQDPRSHGRKLQVDRIERDYAYVRNVRTNRETRIHLSRLTPRKNGYKLDVPAPARRLQENNEGDVPCGDGHIVSDSTPAFGGC